MAFWTYPRLTKAPDSHSHKLEVSWTPQVLMEKIQSENGVVEIFLLSIASFNSRIVLRKLESNQICEFRNVEREYKKVIKLKADISYLLSICLRLRYLKQTVIGKQSRT